MKDEGGRMKVKHALIEAKKTMFQVKENAISEGGCPKDEG